MNDVLAIRSGSDGDWPDVRRLLASAFLTSEDSFGWIEHAFRPARSLVSASGPRMVAHVGAFERELAVPGGIVPAAHVAMVAVDPMYRGRGLSSDLIRRQLTGLRETGKEMIAVLWASEGRRYHRYGYGLAACCMNLRVDLREIRLLGDLNSGCELTEIPVESAQPELRRLYELVWRARPGWSSRGGHWGPPALADPRTPGDGGARPRIVVAEGAAGAEGYAVWQPREGWSDAGPAGTVELHELVAVSPAATTALWRFLLSVDLTRTLRYPMAALDDPVMHLVDEPRRLGALVADALWVRLIDVAGALAGRRYLTPVDLVLNVCDPVLPANTGTWRLCADRVGATCAPTSADPDLALRVRDLGAAYLGGTSLAALGAAGRVTELRAGALAAASTAFGWHRQPSAVEMF